jgi:C-8 sterol isomerase
MKRVFDPEVLSEIAASVTELPKEQKFTELIKRLDQRYPGLIYKKKQRWIFNTANGAMGAMIILYGSFREYLLIFGSPIGTEGHSGTYWAEVHDIMFDGEMRTYFAGDIDATIYKPGDHAVLPRRKNKGYVIKDNGWMLEYAKGAIPTMLPCGLADNLFSNLDFKSLFLTLGHYGQLIIKNYLYRIFKFRKVKRELAAAAKLDIPGNRGHKPQFKGKESLHLVEGKLEITAAKTVEKQPEKETV